MGWWIIDCGEDEEDGMPKAKAKAKATLRWASKYVL